MLDKLNKEKSIIDLLANANPSRYMTITYIMSLSLIAVLSLIVHFMLDRVIIQQDNSGSFINVSGQQRMLSQRTSMFTLEYLISGNMESKEIAQDALKKMVDNHGFLLHHHYESLSKNEASPLSEVMKQMYFHPPLEVDTKIQHFVKLIHRALNQVDPQSDQKAQLLSTDFIAFAKSPLLNAFDTVVTQYEKEGQEKISKLRTAQSIVLIITMITIFLEAIFIFRPMVRKVSEYAERLKYEATHDALSGLMNRRAFNDFAETFFANNKRYNHPLSIIMMDIDYFKKINDSHGHDMGDKAIQWVAQSIKIILGTATLWPVLAGKNLLLYCPMLIK